MCFFAMFGVAFLLAQYLQMVLGYSPFHAGLIMLPMPLTIMVVAPQAPRLVARFGISRVVPAGMTLLAAGLLGLSFLGVDTPIVFIYVTMIPMMAGMAATMSPFTAMIMTSIPPERAGMGSATNDTTRELGGALGVAVLGSVITTQFRSASLSGIDQLPANVQTLARSGLPGSLQAARSLPANLGGPLVTDARRAFVDGFGTATIVGGAVVAVSTVLITLVLRRVSTERMGSAVLHPSGEDPIEQLSEVPLPG
jgi:MFS family permease